MLEKTTALYLQRLKHNLASRDWRTRYEAVMALRLVGSKANDLLASALADLSDEVSRPAQEIFVERGEAVVDYLVEKVAVATDDAGLYARIAGGKETHRRKSLAGTLWLTLVRGVDRDHCFAALDELIRHPSPRVRSVALYSAASVREDRSFGILDVAANDGDPLVTAKFREALVYLSMTAGDLSDDGISRLIDLARPHLAATLDDDGVGIWDENDTLGETLFFQKLRRHADRLVENIEEELPAMTPTAAVQAGRAVAAQLDEEEVAKTMARWVAQLDEENTRGRACIFSALSAFPVAAFDLTTADLLLGADFASHHRSPAVAGRLLQKAAALGDASVAEDALAFLGARFGEEAGRVETAFACWELLKALGKEGAVPLRDRVTEMVAAQADALLADVEKVHPRFLYRLIDLFLAIDDKRTVDVFHAAWEHRYDGELADFGAAMCVQRMARERERSVLPLILEHATSGSRVAHTHLKDVCVYCSAKTRYGEFLDEFLDDEMYARWLSVMRDPEEHPRFRSAFAMVLENPRLSPERREEVAQIYLAYSRPPFNSNLRSKSIWGLGASGDKRVLPSIYGMLLEPEHPSWIYLNCATGLYGIASGARPGQAGKMAAGAAVLVDALEALLLVYPDPPPPGRLVHVSNYFSWMIQQQVYVPRYIVDTLKDATEQDFGFDVGAWREWLSKRQV